jgi:hypothetical protein
MKDPFIIKPTSTQISQIYADMKLHVSGSSSVHHQELSYRFVDSFWAGLGPARKLSTNLYDIYQWRVHSEWTPDVDRGTARNM